MYIPTDTLTSSAFTLSPSTSTTPTLLLNSTTSLLANISSTTSLSRSKRPHTAPPLPEHLQEYTQIGSATIGLDDYYLLKASLRDEILADALASARATVEEELLSVESTNTSCIPTHDAQMQVSDNATRAVEYADEYTYASTETDYASGKAAEWWLEQISTNVYRSTNGHLSHVYEFRYPHPTTCETSLCGGYLSRLHHPLLLSPSTYLFGKRSDGDPADPDAGDFDGAVKPKVRKLPTREEVGQRLKIVYCVTLAYAVLGWLVFVFTAGCTSLTAGDRFLMRVRKFHPWTTHLLGPYASRSELKRRWAIDKARRWRAQALKYKYKVTSDSQKWYEKKLHRIKNTKEGARDENGDPIVSKSWWGKWLAGRDERPKKEVEVESEVESDWTEYEEIIEEKDWIENVEVDPWEQESVVLDDWAPSDWSTSDDDSASDFSMKGDKKRPPSPPLPVRGDDVDFDRPEYDENREYDIDLLIKERADAELKEAAELAARFKMDLQVAQEEDDMFRARFGAELAAEARKFDEEMQRAADRAKGILKPLETNKPQFQRLKDADEKLKAKRAKAGDGDDLDDELQRAADRDKGIIKPQELNKPTFVRLDNGDEKLQRTAVAPWNESELQRPTSPHKLSSEEKKWKRLSNANPFARDGLSVASSASSVSSERSASVRAPSPPLENFGGRASLQERYPAVQQGTSSTPNVLHKRNPQRRDSRSLISLSSGGSESGDSSSDESDTSKPTSEKQIEHSKPWTNPFHGLTDKLSRLQLPQKSPRRPARSAMSDNNVLPLWNDKNTKTETIEMQDLSRSKLEADRTTAHLAARNTAQQRRRAKPLQRIPKGLRKINDAPSHAILSVAKTTMVVGVTPLRRAFEPNFYGQEVVNRAPVRTREVAFAEEAPSKPESKIRSVSPQPTTERDPKEMVKDVPRPTAHPKHSKQQRPKPPISQSPIRESPALPIEETPPVVHKPTIPPFIPPPPSPNPLSPNPSQLLTTLPFLLTKTALSHQQAQDQAIQLAETVGKVAKTLPIIGEEGKTRTIIMHRRPRRGDKAPPLPKETERRKGSLQPASLVVSSPRSRPLVYVPMEVREKLLGAAGGKGGEVKLGETPAEVEISMPVEGTTKGSEEGSSIADADVRPVAKSIAERRLPVQPQPKESPQPQTKARQSTMPESCRPRSQTLDTQQGRPLLGLGISFEVEEPAPKEEIEATSNGLGLGIMPLSDAEASEKVVAREPAKSSAVVPQTIDTSAHTALTPLPQPDGLKSDTQKQPIVSPLDLGDPRPFFAQDPDTQFPTSHPKPPPLLSDPIFTSSHAAPLATLLAHYEYQRVRGNVSLLSASDLQPPRAHFMKPVKGGRKDWYGLPGKPYSRIEKAQMRRVPTAARAWEMKRRGSCGSLGSVGRDEGGEKGREKGKMRGLLEGWRLRGVVKRRRRRSWMSKESAGGKEKVMGRDEMGPQDFVPASPSSVAAQSQRTSSSRAETRSDRAFIPAPPSSVAGQSQRTASTRGGRRLRDALRWRRRNRKDVTEEDDGIELATLSSRESQRDQAK